MNVRARFAPSPTGHLHIGGVRTALFSWLYAKKTEGQFILRIEDTDRERSTQASVDAILQGMDWLGMSFDEGPFYQTKRFDRYQEVIEKMLAEGKAYRCYCSPERLTELRETQMANKEKPRYDGHCRDRQDHDEDKPYCIRFKNPQTGTVAWDDLVKGHIEIANKELDDVIIARTDGTPTYNFTVVVDDMDMNMTHVIRGDDHVNNTPRQINMLKALGASIPQYGHVPMILGEDGKRLSKRHGAVNVMQFKALGYLPEALLNYLVRLGWSYGDQELFTQAEMIELFDLNNVNSSPAAFSFDKLNWVNQHYIKTLPVAKVAKSLAWQFEEKGIDTNTGPTLDQLVSVMAEKVKTLAEMADKSRYFYEDFESFDEAAAKKHLRPVAFEPLKAILENLQNIQTWTADEIDICIQSTAEQLEIGMGKIGMPLRVAVTGTGMSPSLGVTLEMVGKGRSLARVEKAVEFVRVRMG